MMQLRTGPSESLRLQRKRFYGCASRLEHLERMDRLDGGEEHSLSEQAGSLLFAAPLSLALLVRLFAAKISKDSAKRTR